MNKNTVKIFTVSTLCAALLSACGGNGDVSFLGKEGDVSLIGGGNGNDGNGNGSGGNGGVGQVDPTIDKFLVNITDEGQQNSPIVASVNNTGDGDINLPVTDKDVVRFNQPGIVSEVCGWGEDDCVDKNAQKMVEKLRKDAGKTKDEAEKAKLEAWAEAIEDQYPDKGRRVIRDVNGVIVITKVLNTLDFGNMPSKDLGVLKIDKKRTAKGLEDYSGIVGRDFNSVLGFKIIDVSEPNSGSRPTLYLNSYFRNPAVAGWSFQTFGNYIANADNPLLGYLRGQNIGYQSIGQITKELPGNGSATYKGISHAYYNADQVTSHNQINVNFGSKSLSYKTTDSAILHTMEGGLHVIEERPDLNVSGSAKWAGVNRFTGKVSTGNGLQGKIEGQFYGPNAEEVGGVYGLEGNANGKRVNYVGGFGAKKIPQ